MSKKSQVWTIEFILSFIIFVAAMLLSVKSIFNVYTSEDFNEIQRETEFLSQYLLSEGFPYDWNNETVIRIGLTTSKKLNSTKMIELYNMDYERVKYLFGIRSNFFIYFSNASGNIPLFYLINNNITESEGCGYGHSSVTKYYNGECIIEFNSYNDLTKITRLVSFNSSIVQLNLVIWR
ncbi:MAG: hypothetical protein KatS3mg002_1108 [Candidatus Woesearchaeota archaeon]|nr:MAG: hypothetical protein KatS3mg002_1108 [Candidatus Woesearchaeota archaeon]